MVLGRRAAVVSGCGPTRYIIINIKNAVVVGISIKACFIRENAVFVAVPRGKAVSVEVKAFYLVGYAVIVRINIKHIDKVGTVAVYGNEDSAAVAAVVSIIESVAVGIEAGSGYSANPVLGFYIIYQSVVVAIEVEVVGSAVAVVVG